MLFIHPQLSLLYPEVLVIAMSIHPTRVCSHTSCDSLPRSVIPPPVQRPKWYFASLRCVATPRNKPFLIYASRRVRGEAPPVRLTGSASRHAADVSILVPVARPGINHMGGWPAQRISRHGREEEKGNPPDSLLTPLHQIQSRTMEKFQSTISAFVHYKAIMRSAAS